MLLMNALISGGALVASAKLYQKNKRLRASRSAGKKETPWTVYAERVGVIKQKKKNRPILSVSSSLKEAQNTAIDKIQTTLQTFNQEKLVAFRARRQQMLEIVGSEISEEEKKMNRIFAIASANLGLAGISLFYAPLVWLTVPVSIYSTIPLYQLAYKRIVKERRMSSYVLDALLMTGMLFGGYFVTAVVEAWFSSLSQKLLRQSEHHCKKNITNLFGTPPRSVWVTTNGVEVEIPFEKLQRGDIVMVSAGQTICVDGVITTGFAEIVSTS